jgi:hypothetical protein
MYLRLLQSPVTASSHVAPSRQVGYLVLYPVTIAVGFFTLFTLHPYFHLLIKRLVVVDVHTPSVCLGWSGKALSFKPAIGAYLARELKLNGVPFLSFCMDQVSPAVAGYAARRTGQGIFLRIVYKIFMCKKPFTQWIVPFYQADISGNIPALQYLQVGSRAVSLVCTDFLWFQRVVIFLLF